MKTQLILCASSRRAWSARCIAAATMASLGLLAQGPAAAQVPASFAALTQLAQGALTGVNVSTPVSGFELLVLQNGQLLYNQAFGQWSIGQLGNADSATKTLSAGVIMSVTETNPGNFGLDTRLSSLVPSFDRADKRAITVRQAFSHTAGIANNNAGSIILANPNITLLQAANQIAALPMVGAPGAVFSYGGVSMQAAGAAAEAATGQSFVSLFNTRVATPLALSNTRFVLASDSNPRVAGGLESNAADFGRYMDMLLNQGVNRNTGQRVLQAASVQQMLTRQTTAQQTIINSPVSNNLYGIGTWLDQPTATGPAIDALAAGARGFHSWIDKATGVVFVFATDDTTFSNVEALTGLMHVAVLAAVPEPATALLLVCGLLMVAAARRAAQC
jgi:CubicO group peptidase (beta-lactamase class C family)